MFWLSGGLSLLNINSSCLFSLILYVPVNIFQSSRDGSSTNQRIKCPAQGHNAAPQVRLKLVSSLPLSHCAPLGFTMWILISWPQHLCCSPKREWRMFQKSYAISVLIRSNKVFASDCQQHENGYGPVLIDFFILIASASSHGSGEWPESSMLTYTK